MISKFKEKADCLIVIDTSFNERVKFIVFTLTGAFKCFMGTGLDFLAVGNYFLIKEEQNEEFNKSYEID